MATTHGNDGDVYVGSNQVAEVRSWTLNTSNRLAEDTAMGDTDATYKTGVNEASGTVECHYDDTDTNGQEALAVGSSVTLNLYPSGNSSGEPKVSFTALINSENYSVAMADIVSRSFGFQATGALTWSSVT